MLKTGVFTIRPALFKGHSNDGGRAQRCVGRLEAGVPAIKAGDEGDTGQGDGNGGEKPRCREHPDVCWIVC